MKVGTRFPDAFLTEQASIRLVDRATGAALRTAFRSGDGAYPDAPTRLRPYELLGRIRLARHFDVEMDGEPASARAERADEHHAAFDRLLDGGSVLRHD